MAYELDVVEWPLLSKEKCAVKMVMIQDSNTPTAFDKPLRITGDQMKCQRAKEIVLELNASNDDMVGGEFSNGMGVFGGPLDGIDIPEPGAAVGILIPKVGEIIKNIQQETGAKVQFEQEDGQSKGRLCSITGPQDKVKQAQMINNSNNLRGLDFPYCPVDLGGVSFGFFACEIEGGCENIEEDWHKSSKFTRKRYYQCARQLETDNVLVS